MIHHVAKALVSPEDTPDETVANFFPVLFKKLDKHYDIPKNIHWGFEDLHLHFLYKWGDASSQKDHNKSYARNYRLKIQHSTYLCV